MKLKLRVDVDGMYFNGGAIVEVPEPLAQVFEPLHENDSPIFNCLNGGVATGSYEFRRVMSLRENAAEELSQALTKLILDEMKKRDTKNGY